MITASAEDISAIVRSTAGEVIACHECGTVHRLPDMPDDTIARCVACGAKIFIRFEGSVERTLALYLAALALFVVANAFPILSMSIGGQTNASTILDSAKALYDAGMWPLALAVGLAGIAAAARQDPGHARHPGAAAARLASRPGWSPASAGSSGCSPGR